MIKNLLIMTLSFVLCASCISTSIPQKQKESEPEKIKEISEKEFIEQGKEFINHSTGYALLNLINTYGSDYPGKREELLSGLLKTQNSLAEYFLEIEDYYNYWFYLNNICALNKNNEPDMGKLIKGFSQLGQKGITTYLNIDKNISPALGTTPFYKASDFKTIIVEIHVKRQYQTKLGIKRKESFFGTGFFIDRHHILTAFHIVEPLLDVDTEFSEIYIYYNDKKYTKAEIKDWDSITDIAVVEVKEDIPVPEVSFFDYYGNSDSLRQGDTIYTLGHHEGFTATLTKGIISAPKRDAPEVGEWIQIDAHIAPGASGGLLIGEDNRVYGMLVAGIVFEDINFAVPSNLILSVIDRLIRKKSVKRPWLGLLLEEDRDQKIPVSIIEIFPTSSLNDYGIKAGVRLMEINHTKITSVARAKALVNRMFAGNIVHLKIQKDPATVKDFYIHLDRRPDYPIYNATREWNKLSTLWAYFGFQVDIDSKVNKIFTFEGKKYNTDIYRVLKVKRDSILDNMGVVQADYIGIIDDSFYDKTRHLTVIHFPKDLIFSELYSINEIIYELSKGNYDENIL
ncbi:MAG: serine protease [Spirochaetales bacterium]|nr:serine protease [Spirochaetales bacterium]